MLQPLFSQALGAFGRVETLNHIRDVFREMRAMVARAVHSHSQQKGFVVVGKTFRVVGWSNSWGWSCCDSPPSVQRILVSPYLSNRG